MPNLMLALRAAPWVAILALLFALGVVKHRADKWEAQSRKCTAARISDRAAYESAQRAAAAENKADILRIESEQQRISDDVQSNLSARLERLRRELRARTAAPQSAAGKSGSSADGGPAKGADGQARVCVAPGVILRGAENEERHDELITWVERQLAIPR